MDFDLFPGSCQVSIMEWYWLTYPLNCLFPQKASRRDKGTKGISSMKLKRSSKITGQVSPGLEVSSSICWKFPGLVFLSCDSVSPFTIVSVLSFGLR